MKWLDHDGADKDIVVSSRIRLARNIKNIKFPQKLDADSAKDLKSKIKNSIMGDEEINNSYKYYDMKNIDPIKSRVLVEEHLISPGLLEHKDIGGFLLRDDQNVTIMINEEDHIRMQVIYPGLNLEACWEESNKLDDIIEINTEYAFDEKLGYLTSCPTNIGTGMRASVMLHLPSLVLTKQINGILQAVNQIGLTVRGLYGEGSNAMGNLFQISNQTTLGESEIEIIQKLKNIVKQLITNERHAREKIYSTNKVKMEDKVYRSLGILKNARIITSKESMDLLSDIKLGIEMEIIDNIDRMIINKLIIKTQPANVQNKYDKNLSPEERDIKRAEIIRKELDI
ncbi:protein arginine kinase [Clostridium sp. D2Q-11]|uniref:Protein-arginine kinase n=1 Tax=Anaeromonas frigoriresistens TaxID=2683708 RepID=A0A942UQS5_9FIRM|nr:protein arginine kinase [Anaeromonas frigoriresistens]MBS4536848.1 protein arginine kinase [Anaeromonas frigoriresistens]